MTEKEKKEQMGQKEKTKKEMTRLFVVGAGFMGMGIAQTAAMHDVKVKIYDINKEATIKGIKNVNRILTSGVEKGKYTEEEKVRWLSNLEIAEEISECNDADFIIEAAAENLDIKKSIFSSVVPYVKDDTIFATNTSSISITAIASAVDKPENFVGMHFFSPVPVMGLMEVVEGLLTSEETMERAKAFGEMIGKTCITSKDEAGFIVNRMCIPMLNEACVLLERHVSTIEQIDTGIKLGLNHPMGPLELCDMIGIDICYAIMQVLHRETGDDKYRSATILRKMVNAGFLGKKVGKGFYIYENGTKRPNPKMDI